MECYALVICTVLLIYPDMTYGQQGRSSCFVTSVLDHEFEFVFRFAPQGDTSITHLAFYDSTATSFTEVSPVIDNPGQCNGTTISNGVFQVGFAVDGDTALPCGISRSSDTYTITIAVVGSLNRAFRFTCTTGNAGNLLPTYVHITTFETGNIVDRSLFRPNAQSLRLEVFHADGNRVPSITSRLGEYIQIRAIYDQEDQEASIGTDTWGRRFHVVFLQHTDAELGLHIVTRGLGALIKVSGFLTGSTFEEYYPVKRDVETFFFIRETYRHVNQGNAWTTSKRALRIEVIKGSDVALSAFSVQRATTPRRPAGAFLVIPDDLLGLKYNCYTGSTEPGGQVLVYPTEDSTNIVINFNAFNITSITINGNAASPTTTVSLNEYDVLNIQCNLNCDLIIIQADKPVGLVAGHEAAIIDSVDFPPSIDHFVSQIPPVSTYSKNYKVLQIGRYQVIAEDPTSFVNITRPAGVMINVPSGTYINDFDREEVTFSQNVLLLFTSYSDCCSRQRAATMAYPSFEQWAIRYYIFVEPAVSYAMFVIGTIGDVADIEFRDTGNVTNVGPSTIGVMAQGPLQPLDHPSGVPRFERARNIAVYLMPGMGSSLIEIRAPSNNRPFMLVVRENFFGLKNVKFPMIGTRFPTINPCVPSPTTVTSFGTVTHSVPGDMVDNDCNGVIDSDIDDANSPGADLAPHHPNPHIGIQVTSLEVSNKPDFPSDGSGSTYTLIAAGCSVHPSGSTLWIQPFKWNKGIGEQFGTVHVLDTQPFRSFYFQTKTIYFRAGIDFCLGNLTDTKCDDSCLGQSRRRRETRDTIQIETQLTITDSSDDTIGEIGSCTMNKLYWIPAILLFVTILVELIMNGICIIYKIKLESVN